MHSDWFNGIEILQGRWQHGEKVGYCNPSELEKLFVSGTYRVYAPLVTKGLTSCMFTSVHMLVTSPAVFLNHI
jgi:hypothetical protein